MRRVSLALCFLTFPTQALAGVLYVDGSALGANDGSSWADAYVDLQDGLTAAVAGDDLWIAAGTYLPGPTAAASDSFFLKNDVGLYGGFAGGETSLAQRDWVANRTLLSGDVGQDDDLTGWPSWNIHTANSAHVVTGNGVDRSAVLDGLVIGYGSTGPSGTFAGAPEMAGGGLYNVSSSPTVVNCVFEYNLAAWAWGAAIYNLDSSPSITFCTFRYNMVHLSNGAGIGNIDDSAPIIEDCLFIGNQITTGGGGQEGQGAAIANGWYVPPITVERCTFTGNQARQFSQAGFGVEQARGGAVSSFTDGLTVQDCVFRGNRADAGGAIFTWGAATIVNSLFEGNKVYNMVVGGITVSGYGSAIAAWTGADGDIVVDNCSIISNQVVNGESGAMVCNGSSEMQISNSILWGNTAPPPVSPRKVHYKGNIALSHNCIENLFVPYLDDPVPQPEEIPGCIDLDPLFVDELNDNFRLSAGSPCIDVGLNLLVPGLANTDLDGFERVALGATAFTVDMGAHEYGSAAPGACPVVVYEPQALAVVDGQNARFDVLAQAVDLTYQWRKDGVALMDGGALSGTATPSLKVSPAGYSDAGSYDVVVSNACNSVTTNSAVLTVEAPPLGAVVCSGDGEVVSCPCGNDKDFGMGCENSSGEGARLDGSGSQSLAAGTAVLTVDQLPANKWGLMFMGGSLVTGGYGIAFGDGLLCTISIKRFPTQNSGASGTLTLINPGAQAPGQIAPGDTRIFQAWFRDPGGPCASGWNTSNAYRVVFEP